MLLLPRHGRVDFLIVAQRPRGLPWETADHGELRARISAQLETIRRRVNQEGSGRLIGVLASAPLALVRCPEERAARLLGAMHSWPEIRRVESVIPEPFDLAFPDPSSSTSRATHGPVLGIAEIGRPDLHDPEIIRRLIAMPSRPAFELYGDNTVARHPGAVLAAFLDGLMVHAPSRCIFESLRADCGPFSWLAAMDRLLDRGANLINLSYGRRAIEREEGWAALEWGTQLLCHLHDAVIVAAAGQPSDRVPHGFHLHLPASVPEVIPADGERRWWGPAGDTDERRILLASAEDPLGGVRASSFAAPRISALVCEILASLPESQWTPSWVRKLLLETSDPLPPGIPAAGRPDPERLRRLLCDGPQTLSRRAAAS